MNIQCIISGVLQENAYIVNVNETGAVVIDPGDNAPDILAYLREKDLDAKLILLTHAHEDHTGAVIALQQAYGTLIALHRGDHGLLQGSVPQVDGAKFVDSEDILSMCGMDIRVIHTPGHSMGSCCYLVNGVLFTGDTLFAGTIGRTDFPESSWESMQISLKLLRTLPDETIVYPGHGPATTIGTEKAMNPWMR